jgi:hypothetical protein
MAKNLASKLKGLQKAWKNSEPQRGGVGVPDGMYPCRIDEAVLQEAKSSGRLQIKWGMSVIDGDHENKKIYKYDGLDNEQALGFIMGTFETLELEIPDNIEEIGEALEAAVGLECMVQVKTKDEFTNIYFNDLLDSDGSEDEEEEEDESDEEEESDDDDSDSDEEEEEESDDEDGAEDEDEEEAEEEEELSAKDINGMSKSELVSLIEEEELGKKVKGYKTMDVKALRKGVIKALGL